MPNALIPSALLFKALPGSAGSRLVRGGSPGTYGLGGKPAVKPENGECGDWGIIRGRGASSPGAREGL